MEVSLANRIESSIVSSRDLLRFDELEVGEGIDVRGHVARRSAIVDLDTFERIFAGSDIGSAERSNHWGRRHLETGRNMSGTLKGEEPFAWHVSTGHISGTCVMFLAHFTHV